MLGLNRHGRRPGRTSIKLPCCFFVAIHAAEYSSRLRTSSRTFGSLLRKGKGGGRQLDRQDVLGPDPSTVVPCVVTVLNLIGPCRFYGKGPLSGRSAGGQTYGKTLFCLPYLPGGAAGPGSVAPG